MASRPAPAGTFHAEPIHTNTPDRSVVSDKKQISLFGVPNIDVLYCSSARFLAPRRVGLMRAPTARSQAVSRTSHFTRTSLPHGKDTHCA